MNNTIDLNQASGLLLGLAGGVLQFAMRQFKGVKEFWYHIVAAVLTVGCFFLVVRDWPAADPRDSFIVLALWVSGHITAVYGGTFITSVGAHQVAEMASSKTEKAEVAKNLLVPITDSKGE